MGCGPESRCVGCVYILDGAMQLVLSCWGVCTIYSSDQSSVLFHILLVCSYIL